MFSRLICPLLLAGWLTVVGACDSKGDIIWQQRTAELRADPGAAANTVLEARYPFENTGKSAVEITSLQSDCGCTVPKLEKRRYAPGEKGEVLARFTVGEGTGRIEKHILVTVSGEHDPAKLTLVALVPELLRIEGAPVVWSRNGDKAAKKMTITAGADITVKKLTVHSSQELVTPELRVLEDGHRYELAVTPVRTDLPLVALLTLSGEFDVAMPVDGGNADHGIQRTTVAKVITVYATVK